MSYSPIAFVAPNYRDYKTYWLKAYIPATTTPKIMAIDGTLGVAKLQLNADGFLVSAGGAIVMPYIEGAYDAYLFRTETEADANDTTNAVRVADNITAGTGGGADITIGINTVEEIQTLSSGQTTVVFSTIDTGLSYLQIVGPDSDAGSVDDGPLELNTDYQILDTFTITLSVSYPEGSKVIARQNQSQSTSKVETPKSLNDLLRETNRSISVWGHRQLQGYAPENTISAALQALAKGVMMLELDVQWSSDGVAVIMHDTTVDRTTDGSGNVADLTLAQLKALDAGTWFSSTFAGETVPTYAEMIEAIIHGGGTPLIEIKEGAYTDIQLQDLVTYTRSVSWDNGHVYLVRTEAAFELIRGVNPFANIVYYPNTGEPTTTNAAYVQRKGNASLHLDADYSTVFDFAPYSFPITALNVRYSYQIQEAAKRGFAAIGSDYYMEIGR